MSVWFWRNTCIIHTHTHSSYPRPYLLTSSLPSNTLLHTPFPLLPYSSSLCPCKAFIHSPTMDQSSCTSHNLEVNPSKPGSQMLLSNSFSSEELVDLSASILEILPVDDSGWEFVHRRHPLICWLKNFHIFFNLCLTIPPPPLEATCLPIHV